ncbi:MAG TPA: hypothetical protein VHL52_07925 [Acidimicrobiia bacterium]|nr:hypothetical protein [Acidimicrobiia bacterium]
MLAFFMECACPPDGRSLTVGAGELASVEEFLDSYPLTHIVCQSCDSYYQLIGYIDQDGVERRVGPSIEPSLSRTRRGRRMASAIRSRL